MRSLVSIPQVACTVGGMVVGGLFGDVIFRRLETVFGDPLTDVFLGVGGALLGAIIYEIVMACRDCTNASAQ